MQCGPTSSATCVHVHTVLKQHLCCLEFSLRQCRMQCSHATPILCVDIRTAVKQGQCDVKLSISGAGYGGTFSEYFISSFFYSGCTTSWSRFCRLIVDGVRSTTPSKDTAASMHPDRKIATSRFPLSDTMSKHV